jgi:hypothetical protein
MAALSSIVLDPLKIRSILQSEENSNGIYAVKLFIRGKPWLITIDDKIPIIYKSLTKKQLLYGLNYLNSSWASIIEKSWAKAQGCYENIKGGYSA